MARPHRTTAVPLAERFASKVRRDPCGCLLWTAGGLASGRGTIVVRRAEIDGAKGHRMKLASHVAFFLAHGRWPVSLRHTCDTPSCVEEAHLVEGDQAANMADMVARGRQQRGAGHYRSKLTEADVFDIRWARSLGARPRDLGPAYGVNQSTITAVCSNRNWRIA